MKERCNFKKIIVPVNAEGQAPQGRKLYLFPAESRGRAEPAFPAWETFLPGLCSESSPSCSILQLSAGRSHTSKAHISDVSWFFLQYDIPTQRTLFGAS